MKKQTYMLVAMIMLIAVVGLSSAKAQTSGPTILRVDIPFAFSAGNQTLPAGEYWVTCVNAASDMKILQLRDKAGHATVLVRTSSAIGKTRQSNPRLQSIWRTVLLCAGLATGRHLRDAGAKISH